MDKTLTSELIAEFKRVTVPYYEGMARRWGWFGNQEESMEQDYPAFLESRVSDLQAEVANLTALLKTYQEIAATVETKNCELRQKLRLLDDPVEPFDDGAKA